MSKTVIALSTPHAPHPFGHYAQGVKHGDQIFVSGQLAANPDGSHGYDTDFEDQVRRCLENLLAIVEAGGGSRRSIARVTAYIVGAEHWPAFNRVYAEFFGDVTPARSVVPTPELHHGYLIELDAIAFEDA